jgi:hypothetical protein
VRGDRFLLAILIAIGVLVVVAIGLFYTRGGTGDYGLEDSPEGVLHNYILALEKGDYQRAYGYLHDAPGKPEFNQFRGAFLNGELSTSLAAVQIGETRKSGDDVILALVVIHGGSGPFGDSQRESTHALLVQGEAGEWKIANLSYPYWGWDWYTSRQTP